MKGHKDVVIQDLPGIYSLSPYTLEEVVARGFLVKEKPDAIINILDGTNVERNLYLTTQLLELGIPVVIAVNMIDIVRKNGDKIDLAKLGAELGCAVMETSALKGEGSMAVAEKAIAIARAARPMSSPCVYGKCGACHCPHRRIHLRQSGCAEPALVRYQLLSAMKKWLRSWTSAAV